VSRILNEIARSDHKPKEYLSVLRNNSLLGWTWLVGKKTRCTLLQHMNQYKLLCILFLSLIPFALYVISDYTNPRMRVIVRVCSKSVFSKSVLKLSSRQM